jgi:hypothetical protein
MTDPSDAPERRSPHGIAFWVALPIGIVIASVGVRSYLARYHDGVRRLALAKWIVGVDVVHDAVLVPLVIVTGLVLRRIVPRSLLRPMQFGFAATGVIALLAWRPLMHSGAGKRNPSVQPLDYPLATLTAIGAVWFVAFAWAVWSWSVSRRARPAGRWRSKS